MSRRSDDLGISDQVGDDWRDLFIPNLVSGVAEDLDEELIPNSNLLRGRNVIIDRNILRKDFGYDGSGTATLVGEHSDSTSFVALSNLNGFSANAYVRIALDDGSFSINQISSVQEEEPQGVVLFDLLDPDLGGVSASDGNLFTLVKNFFYGVPRRLVSYRTIGGVDIELLICNEHIYRRLSDSWYVLGEGTDTTISTNEAAGQKTLSVIATSNFTVGEVIGVTLDDNTQHLTTIVSIDDATELTVDDALPSAASAGNAVVEAAKFAGTMSNPVDVVHPPWDDILIITNGVDNVKQFDPSTDEVTDVPNLPSSGNTKCKALALFDSSVFLLSTTEGGTTFRQRVRWCDKADITNWSTGLASFIDLFDSTDEVRDGLMMGPFLYIYRADSIARCQLDSSLRRRFTFDTLVTDEGIIATHCVVDVEDYHILVGNDNIYKYTGGLDLEPIGDPIRNKIFGATADMDEDNRGKSFLVYISQREEILFNFQDTAGSNVNRAWRYRIKEQAWLEREWSNEFSGFGDTTRLTSLTWNDLIGSWNDQTWIWGGTSGLVGSPITVFLDANGRVLYYDLIAPHDAGQKQAVDIITKDYAHPNFFTRFDYIEVKAGGSNIKISRSHDFGGTWTEISTISPGSIPTRERIEEQWVERVNRFRFETSDSFELNWLHFRFALEYEW